VDVLHLPPVGDEHAFKRWRGKAVTVREEEEQGLAAGGVRGRVEEVLEGCNGRAADVEGVGWVCREWGVGGGGARQQGEGGRGGAGKSRADASVMSHPAD
jgi:hypothetical protein